VLTDGGGEFKAEFAAACAALGIRHTRIKPRHAWTNGFVERLQQTILTEYWGVVFRRHYLTYPPHPLIHCPSSFLSVAAQMAWINKRPTTSITAQVTP